MVSGFVLMVVVYLVMLNAVCFSSLGMSCVLSVCVVCLMDVVLFIGFDLYNLRCSWSGSNMVSSCRYWVFVAGIHAVAVLNTAFCVV